MSWAAAISLVVLGLGALYWLTAAVLGERTFRAVPLLDGRSPAPAVWPKVSVLIPARDEAATIGPALRSHLVVDYPEVEWIVVDDRSRDATGAIIDQIAAGDRRIKVLHLADLPAGWLGKVHALHQAVQRATGDWLLAMDADVDLAPAALRAAVAYSEARGLDFLTAMPRLRGAGVLVDAATAVMERALNGMGRVWQASDPSSAVAYGIGAFCLVRRSALARTPGFEWLRLEVADDMGLAFMLKRSGARCGVVNGRDLLAITFYRSIGEMFCRMEKGAWAIIGRFRLIRACGFALLLPALELAAVVGFLPFGVGWLPVVAGATMLLALSSCVRAGR
ncbi:MAG: glycosyltransferase, partial [Deltaproteobacteria bacterium]|nr:glycosyltransferase [Deltaproteobacteria bacterium]